MKKDEFEKTLLEIEEKGILVIDVEEYYLDTESSVKKGLCEKAYCEMGRHGC